VSEVRVAIEPAPSADDIRAVEQGLLAYNVERSGDPQIEPVTVLARDDAGAVAGGLIGVIRWRWLYVSKLWVRADQRGQGLGASLMAVAEARARERGCLGISLDTFEYQARPFYEKLGFEVFGTLDGYPPGYRQFYLAKRLTG
jgi:GNAT superfamily N-acetyltransferase